MKKARTSVQFTNERTYTVRRPKFNLFKNVEYLDTAKLSKGSHTIELGQFEGADCIVTAEISDGMIKGINYPACDGSIEIPPKFARKLEAARRELRNGQPKWEDIPVQQLTKSAAARAQVVIIITTSDDCVEICYVDPSTGLQTCMMCCPGWCIGPSEPHIFF